MKVWIVAGIALLTGGCTPERATMAPAEAHPPEAQAAVEEFRRAVDALSAAHRRAAESLGSKDETATGEQLLSRRKALVAALQKERRDARNGAVFTPAVAGYFRSVIRSEVRGSEGAAARELTKDGNPSTEGNLQAITLVANSPYPDGQPLSTVPPTLLLRLPRLPETFDYRFVGRALILRDVEANLILDVLPDALP